VNCSQWQSLISLLPKRLFLGSYLVLISAPISAISSVTAGLVAAVLVVRLPSDFFSDFLSIVVFADPIGRGVRLHSLSGIGNIELVLEPVLLLVFLNLDGLPRLQGFYLRCERVFSRIPGMDLEGVNVELKIARDRHLAAEIQAALIAPRGRKLQVAQVGKLVRV